MKDKWQSADPYEYYMGRWSKLIALAFLDWLSPASGLRWLDVGCGSGALSEAIINKAKPKMVTAVDQSEDFVNKTQERLGNQVHGKVGNALSLPLENASVDIVVSGLVLNFIPQAQKALAEMKRAVSNGGIVSAYIWDYTGKMDLLNYFWDSAVELDPQTAHLHESQRFPKSNAEELRTLFIRSGFGGIETAPIEIITHFQNFDDYWRPFLGGQGPAPTYVMQLQESQRIALRNKLAERLPVNKDGSVSLTARAWAVKGVV